jgi:hypothetical protein
LIHGNEVRETHASSLVNKQTVVSKVFNISQNSLTF